MSGKSEVVGKYKTYDGVVVLLWSDGELTDKLGRGFSRIKLPFWAAAIVAHESAIMDANEIPDAMRFAKKLAHKNILSPGALREAMG